MSPPARTVAFLVAFAGLAAALGAAIAGLPGFGHYPGPYGDVLDGLSVVQRHTTDVVTAINFDYRGFDTLGEEFILFTAATGVSLVLRHLRDEEEGPAPEEVAAERRSSSQGGAVRVAAVLLVGPTVVVGWNIASHGQVNPGGGFQGGVILGSALVLVYLGGQFLAFQRLGPDQLLDAAEGAGAAAFALIGLGALVAGSAYLQDVLPLGPTSSTVLSSGTIALISAAVGVEVAASLLLVVSELLGQTLLVRRSAR